jgi:hypothetical protein
MSRVIPGVIYQAITTLWVTQCGLNLCRKCACLRYPSHRAITWRGSFVVLHSRLCRACYHALLGYETRRVINAKNYMSVEKHTRKAEELMLLQAFTWVRSRICRILEPKVWGACA